MQFFPFVVVAWILCVGLYGIVTSRHLVHLIVCLIVVQSSTYVLLLGVGYKTGGGGAVLLRHPAAHPGRGPGRAGARADRRGGRSGRDRAAAGVRHPGAQAVRHARPARARQSRADGDARLPAAAAVAVPLLAPAGDARRAEPAAPPPAIATWIASPRHRRRCRRPAAVLMLGQPWRPASTGSAASGRRTGWRSGIDFAVDPLGAGLACLAAVLVTAALVFSWRYFERSAPTTTP